MDSLSGDQRAEHRLSPNAPVSLPELGKLGVAYWRIPQLSAGAWDQDERLAAVRAVRGYDYHDVCDISPATLPDYENKIKSFYEEHIHEDEEIRCVLAGSGFFDVRDADDRWIRIKCNPGDMIVLPAGIYHRFTLDEGNYIKALRLFQGVPVWTPLNRPQEDHQARLKYVNEILAN